MEEGILIPRWAVTADDEPLGSQAGEGGFARAVREPKSGAILLLVPSGTYRRGAAAGEAGCHEREQPAHSVTLGDPFYLGRFAVTQQQWRNVMGDDPSRSSGLENPVENMSFDALREFLAATGLHLPTEAQWEYACRAGSTEARYGPKLGRMAWYSENSANMPREVGSRDPNDWGFYDMLGNVWEWCEDWYDADEYNRCVDGATNPCGPSNGTDRVVRGGSYSNGEIQCRAAHRHHLPERRCGPTTGFRCMGAASTT